LENVSTWNYNFPGGGSLFMDNITADEIPGVIAWRKKNWGSQLPDHIHLVPEMYEPGADSETATHTVFVHSNTVPYALLAYISMLDPLIKITVDWDKTFATAHTHIFGISTFSNGVEETKSLAVSYYAKDALIRFGESNSWFKEWDLLQDHIAGIEDVRRKKDIVKVNCHSFDYKTKTHLYNTILSS